MHWHTSWRERRTIANHHRHTRFSLQIMRFVLVPGLEVCSCGIGRDSSQLLTLSQIGARRDFDAMPVCMIVLWSPCGKVDRDLEHLRHPKSSQRGQGESWSLPKTNLAGTLRELCGDTLLCPEAAGRPPERSQDSPRAPGCSWSTPGISQEPPSRSFRKLWGHFLMSDFQETQ